MTKFLNAYSGKIHVSGYVHVKQSGRYELSQVEIHSGDCTRDEAGDMLFDQMDKELENCANYELNGNPLFDENMFCNE